MRAITTSTAETACEITVASATPATSILNATTKSTFSSTLSTPAMERKSSGLRISPAARRMDAPKLYTMLTVMPQK